LYGLSVGHIYSINVLLPYSTLLKAVGQANSSTIRLVFFYQILRDPILSSIFFTPYYLSSRFPPKTLILPLSWAVWPNNILPESSSHMTKSLDLVSEFFFHNLKQSIIKMYKIVKFYLHNIKKIHTPNLLLLGWPYEQVPDLVVMHKYNNNPTQSNFLRKSNSLNLIMNPLPSAFLSHYPLSTTY